jgi:hypothetical protein
MLCVHGVYGRIFEHAQFGKEINLYFLLIIPGLDLLAPSIFVAQVSWPGVWSYILSEK